MNNDPGSNIYCFSPQELQYAMMLFQSDVSDSRNVTLVKRLAQLKHTYGSAAIHDRTPAHRVNEGGMSKHRAVNKRLTDAALTGKLVPWFPRFGPEMASLDKSLYSKCLNQLFSRRDSADDSTLGRQN